MHGNIHILERECQIRITAGSSCGTD